MQENDVEPNSNTLHLAYSKKSLVLISCLCAFVITIFLPAFMIVNNRSEFIAFNILDVVKGAYLAFFFVAISVFCISLILQKMSAKIGLKPVIFLLFFLVSTAGYFPLRSGLFDGVDKIAFHWPIFLLLTTIGIIATAWRSKIVFYLSLIFLGTATGSLVFQSMNMEYEKHENKPILISKNANIFVILFDSLEFGDVIPVIQSSPALKKSFGGFTAYENATAVVPYSHMSLQTMKSGEVINDGETSRSISTLDFKKRTIDSQITTILSNNGVSVNTFRLFNENEKDSTNQFQTYRVGVENRLFKDAYILAVKSGFARSIPAFENLISNFLGITLFPGSGTADSKGEQVLEDKFDEVLHRTKQKNAENKKTFFEFLAFSERIEPKLDNPAAHFMHLTFTHNPIMLTADCDISNVPTSDQRAMVPNEVKCAMDTFADFLDRLRAYGVYDNSQIIFASDHGYECFVTKQTRLKMHKVSNRWCLSRYEPLLMVKQVNSEDNFNVSQFEASLLDVAPTICRENFPELAACKKYMGVNLSDKSELNSSKGRYILKPADNNDERNLSNFDVVDIGRKNGIETYFGLVRDGKGKYDFDSSRLVKTENGFSLDLKQGAASFSAPKYLDLKPSNQGVVITGTAPDDAISGGKTGGAWLRIPKEFEEIFSDNKIKISALVRGTKNTSLKISYSTNDVGNSGWRTWELGDPEFKWKSFKYKVKPTKRGLFDYVGFIPVGDAVEIKALKIELAN